MSSFPYPLLTYYMQGYLHQDWDLEYASDLEALDDFLDGTSNDAVLMSEIDSALMMATDELNEEVFRNCAYYFGDSAHDWLNILRAHLLKRLGGGGPGANAPGSPAP